jgi:hypothetical protein
MFPFLPDMDVESNMLIPLHAMNLFAAANGVTDGPTG